MLDRLKSVLIFDKKNIIRLIITAVVSIAGAVLTYYEYSEAFAGFIFFLFLALFTFKVSSKKLFILDIILPLYTGLFVLYYFQLGNTVGHELAKRLPQYWGFLLIENKILYELPLVIFFYFLFRLFRLSPKIAAAVTPAPLMLLSLVNYFVYQARDHEFVFYDIFSVKTAMNVAGNYHFSFLIPIAFYVLPYASFVLSFIHWQTEKSAVKARIEVPVAAVLTLVFGYLAYLCPNLWFEKPNHTYKEWGDMPSTEAGFYLAFVKSIGVSIVSKPDGYSVDGLNKELDGTVTKLEAEKDTPNIIVIMNESYADLDLYKDKTQCVKNPDPYWDSLKETCVHGWANASVFAGNTCNSEFEFLTGLSMGFLPTSSVPYHSYIEDKTYSINWALKDMGYETVLMHPYLRTGWNRLNVYPRLGFDKLMFIDDMEKVKKFKEEDAIDNKITDMAAYERIIDYIENEKGDKKLFTYMVTIQNHSGYDNHETEPDVYTTSLGNKNYEFNTYQSLVNMSDEALKMLTEYLSKQDEEYLVLVFGDHQPDVGVTENEDFAFDGKGWKVPYLIWTNYDYDVKANQPDENQATSLNYLGLDVLKIAGFKYNNYYGMLDNIRQEVPCLTVCGHRTADGKLFERVEDNIYENDSDASRSLLQKYQWFEYNQLFDKNKSVMMKDYRFAE